MTDNSGAPIIAVLVMILTLVGLAFGGIAANKVSDGWKQAAISDARNRTADAEHQRQLERNADQREQAEFQARLPGIEAEAQEDAAFSATLIAVWETAAWVVPTAMVMIALPASLAGGAGLLVCVPLLLIYWTRARRTRMELAASLVPLDRRTGQYPLITREVGGVLCITNPNDDSVIVINGNRAQPVPHKIAGSQYTQSTYVLASHAQKAKKPEAMGYVNPAMLAAETEE